ncbi:hypothetical protein D9Y32_14750 [Bacillus licheniformis]|uniref:hypothetical protein n=1 Tax=Bacillus licheniformis TaxID=1402 RepID=UPI00115C8D09|nr:hypothetical protein D9Y32_14750 [Bacillus licheniformis]
MPIILFLVDSNSSYNFSLKETLNNGKHLIKGIPWAGKGFITKLEISIDGGITWLNAMLESAKNAGYGWRSWSYEWTVLDKGEYKIMTKATDSYDRTQPTLPFWNRKGYGYNAIDEI